MKKKNRWKKLAVAGSFVVLASSCFTMNCCAKIINEKEYPVSSREECRRILMEFVSGTEIGSREEVLLTGKNYEPESLAIAQAFPDVINISNTKLAEYEEGGDRYITHRIGFERILEKEDSDYEKEIIDGDFEKRHWKIGDRSSCQIGSQTYIFRCIDEDYGNNSRYLKCVLFLCESVIGSDIDSTESQREILTFGRTNNYKTSEVRKWLQKNQNDEKTQFVYVNTGVNSAFSGTTTPQSYEQFTTSLLSRNELELQSAEDSLFLLSLEEALKYRNELWRLEGNSNAFCRGYWLRTPGYQTNDRDQFCYGDQIYIVDLENGCLRTSDVEDGSIGIRPAFCLPQG